MTRIKILVLLISFMVFGTALASDAPKLQVISSEKALADKVKTKTVCFTTHNGDDPVEVAITGTLFYKGSYKPSSKVIIAVHGFVNDRRIWDGGPLEPELDNSFARALASAGYVVITYDRLGYGQSPYLDSGFSITMENQLEMLHNIINQTKSGSYTETNITCPSGTPTNFGFEKIILLGHSGGAAIIESYAGLNHDVSAIIPMAHSNAGLNSEFFSNIIMGWIIPEIGSGHDYITMFPPNPNGTISEECVHYFFYEPGANPNMYNRYCANQNLIPSPAGEYISAFEFWENTYKRIPDIEERLPVLLIFADNDLLFNETQGEEIAYWKQNCKCDLSIINQTSSGHMLMFHKSNEATINTIINWLHSRGLCPDSKRPQE